MSTRRPSPTLGAARSMPTMQPAAVDVDALIKAAPGKASLPWELPAVRDDFKRALNVDIADPVLLKMEFLAKLNGLSKRAMVERLLELAADAELRSLGIVVAGDERDNNPVDLRAERMPRAGEDRGDPRSRARRQSEIAEAESALTRRLTR